MSLSAYIKESTVTEPGARMTQRGLYESFAKWCELHLVDVPSKHAFTKQLLHRPGIVSSPCRTYYLGLRLAAPNEIKPNETIYRELFTRRAPGLLPAFETWVLDKSRPLELILLDSVLDRILGATS